MIFPWDLWVQPEKTILSLLLLTELLTGLGEMNIMAILVGH